jgi:hypothetical protein
MKRPTSFTLLGLYLGWKAIEGAFLALELDVAGPLPDRGVSLLAAVFAAVAAEALWRCRPWCVRATVGYFAAATVVPLVASATDHDLMPGEAVFTVLTKAIIFAMPVLYVNYRASQLFAPQPTPARIPVPRP